VRRLNRYVEERAPWQLAKDEAKAGELDQTLRSLAEGLRVVTVLLAPYMPESTAKLLAALGDDRIELSAATFGEGPGGGSIGELPPLFPKP
jgi:methionyl-tRNA synthetase